MSGFCLSAPGMGTTRKIVRQIRIRQIRKLQRRQTGTLGRPESMANDGEDSLNRPDNERVEHTPAYASFQRNTDKLLDLLNLIFSAQQAFMQEIDASALHDPELHDAKQRADTLATVKRLTESVGNHIRQLRTALEVFPIVLVTTVEAYLHDVLVCASGLDSSLMTTRTRSGRDGGQSERTASYPEVCSARSLDELKTALRSRWATNWINRGGPSRWISRLQRMGVNRYAANTASDMEYLWGIRHVIVHSAGVVTVAFVRRHRAPTAGERVQLTYPQLRKWAELIYHFVDVTDAYFVQRLRPRLSTQALKEND